MEILANIPFSLDTDSLMQQAHIKPRSDDADELLILVNLAQRIGKPKAAYTVAFVGRREDDSVEIGDILFKSRILSRNLNSVERVFPFIATCGCDMDEAIDVRNDMLKEFWWDLIKAHLLDASYKFLSDHLLHRFRLGKTSTMHPGSGDATVWPIDQQRQLFALVGDVQEAIGVRLTDSCLMIPNKTISGILIPTEKDFKSCQVCHRENCPSRQAPFNKLLWEEIEQHQPF
jgi:hypothetical protein